MLKKEIEKRVEEAQEKNTAFKVYSESDVFVSAGKEQFSVLDYWRFEFSNLVSLPSFYSIAEFLVAKAIGNTKAENSGYWTAYDMSYKNQRVEIKSSVYVHPWNKTRVSEVRSFSIEPTKNSYWSSEDKGYERQNDLYVFCLNTNKEIDKVDPLNIDFWEFYVVPTFVINEYANPMQKSISYRVVKRLSGGGVSYSGLKDKIDEAVDIIKSHYNEVEGKKL